MTSPIGQLFIIGLQEPHLTAQEAQLIVDNDVGGVVLFERNYESPQQLHSLISEIQNLRHKTASQAPLFISIDMEGGRVARLKAPFTQWPPMGKLGSLDSTSAAFKLASSMGAELQAIGVNLNFAPCIDVLTNPANQVIGDRSIGGDTEQVSKLSSALVRGFIKSGIIPCAKHFPGHGGTNDDSHEKLPVETIDQHELSEKHLPPFKKAFRARLDFVMTAHIQFPKIDPEWPVTLSEKFLKEIMRDELKYRNLVITDDLDMKALTDHYDPSQIPVQALKAGANILLYCNKPESPPRALEAVQKALSDGEIESNWVSNTLKQILSIKKKIKQIGPIDMGEVSRIIGHPDHLRLSKALLEGELPEDLQT